MILKIKELKDELLVYTLKILKINNFPFHHCSFYIFIYFYIIYTYIYIYESLRNVHVINKYFL